MSYDEKIAKADEELAKKQKHRDHLVVIKTAESEIPSIWNTGQVTQAQLATKYGISQVTVRRILVDAGCTISRMRKLSPEERAEVASLIQQGERVDHLAGLYHVSRNTIRRVGLSEGVLIKGVRKPRRSDEEYALIEAFDKEARARFNGAGLYNLGLGLKQWKSKKKHQDEILARSAQTAAFVDDPEPLVSPDNAISTLVDPDDSGAMNDGPPPEPTPEVEWPPPSHTPDPASPFAPTVEDDTRSF